MVCQSTSSVCEPGKINGGGLVIWMEGNWFYGWRGGGVGAHLVQILPAGRLERMLKDLDLLDDHEMVIVGRQAQH
eukprot:357989-Chlamydomonas_euryale.AAC.1